MGAKELFALLLKLLNLKQLFLITVVLVIIRLDL